MFELSVACKYLIPRRRQLSVSIITIVSTLVISVVVWLILVFFSVTTGLEKGWVDKLIALTAPIRLTPTDDYYRSYYYAIDSLSDSSDYSTKTIGEKLLAEATDPYDPSVDMEQPAFFPLPDRTSEGSVKDIVKETFATINSLGYESGDYDHAIAQMRLRLVRDDTTFGTTKQTFLTQGCYIASFDEKNKSLASIALKPTAADISNTLELLATTAITAREDLPARDDHVNADIFQKRLASFVDNVVITQLKTPAHGWRIPRAILPQNAFFTAHALIDSNNNVIAAVIPHKTPSHSSHEEMPATVTIDDGEIIVTAQGIQWHNTPLILAGDTPLKASLDTQSSRSALSPSDLLFDIAIDIQGNTLRGKVAYGTLLIGTATARSTFDTMPAMAPPWMHTAHEITIIPSIETIGDGILVSKGFRDHGVRLGDRGYLSYYTMTAGAMQEQRIDVYVAGFYDPGIIPLGGKFILATPKVTSLINSATHSNDKTFGNGINVWFQNVESAPAVKTSIANALEKRGLAHYWHIETFREYEFTKDLLEQLQSEKYLFSLIAIIIMIVACSNIITMLVLLVNDKKKEIGIMMSLGASRGSVALIFGLCGIIIGIISSAIGTLAAAMTMHFLPELLGILTAIQGHEILSSAFYGDALPTTLSKGPLEFVTIATAAASLLAGIIPAIKASLLKPTTLLRSE